MKPQYRIRELFDEARQESYFSGEMLSPKRTANTKTCLFPAAIRRGGIRPKHRSLRQRAFQCRDKLRGENIRAKIIKLAKCKWIAFSDEALYAILESGNICHKRYKLIQRQALSLNTSWEK